MTRQAAETANALFARIQSVFDDRPRTRDIESAAGQANWPANFGGDIPDVRTIVVHTTSGWPTRDKYDEFVDRYTNPHATNRGVGPHFYLAHDGTVFRLLSENRQCWHATHVNPWAIGVETGNLTEVGAPAGGAWPTHWVQLSTDAEDLPGSKYYARFVNNEILVSMWSTNNQAQADSNPSARVMMLLSEAQYRSWALLGRWLAEVWRVPRNFPIRPHLMRGNTWAAANWRIYRQVVDADPMRDPHIRTQLQPAPFNCTPAIFASNLPATGLPHVYAQGVAQTTWNQGGTVHHKQVNNLWTRLFNSYRGFHGHGYSGANTHDDHNCPGARFDWHRFAREVWDFCWLPFDLARAAPGGPIASGQPRRDYGSTSGVLSDHYFDVDASLHARVTTSGFYPIGDETVTPHPVAGPPQGLIGEIVRMFRRYWGFWHGGMHFQLAAQSPLYSLANGQLVAARYPLAHPGEGAIHRDDNTGPYPSGRFLLFRHELFYQRRAGGDRLDYDQEPLRVYVLHMHLGAPTGMSLDAVNAANPVWLNRALTMKKEYDLGLAFHTAHPNPAAGWIPHLTRWQRRQTAIDQALVELRAGRVARFPEGEDAIRVALGDFIGVAGHLDRNMSGMHLEVFSRDPIDDPWFQRQDQSASASRPFHAEANLDDVTTFINSRVQAPANGLGAVNVYRDLPNEQKTTRFQNIALRSKSEWALVQTDFPAGGWSTVQPLMWWADVVPAMNAALATDARSQLPADAIVWHYHPLGFMSFVNNLTWRSEWSKYRVVDAAGAAVPVPAHPPPRR